jgi:hypothetical protein
MSNNEKDTTFFDEIRDRQKAKDQAEQDRNDRASSRGLDQAFGKPRTPGESTAMDDLRRDKTGGSN